MVWVDHNEEDLYAKYAPEIILFKGYASNIVFHGSCLGCASQEIHGIDRCKNCTFFKFDPSKPNLSIERK